MQNRKNYHLYKAFLSVFGRKRSWRSNRRDFLPDFKRPLGNSRCFSYCTVQYSLRTWRGSVLCWSGQTSAQAACRSNCYYDFSWYGSGTGMRSAFALRFGNARLKLQATTKPRSSSGLNSGEKMDFFVKKQYTKSKEAYYG